MTENKRDELLQYYEQELDYFRSMGAAFAQRYPKIASRLELSTSQVSDPHVERLIEAFAFMTGRIQYNIDNEFPEITYALLDNLYPHFVEPLPSVSVAQLHFDANAKVNTGVALARDLQLTAQMSEGYSINFRTAFSTTLYPFTITACEVTDPALFTGLGFQREASAVIRLRFETKDNPLEQFDISNLRFYLGGNKSVAFELYELMHTSLLDIAIVTEGSNTPRSISAKSIKEVGFSEDEQVLPSRPTSHPQYRLLQEYFAFPEKYLFFDVANINTVKPSGSSFEILFVLSQMIQEHRLVSKDNFMINAVPVVNLFPKVSEPMYVDNKHIQYRLIPDVRRDLITEIHSIRSVSGSTDDRAKSEELRPYFSLHHGSRVAASQKAYWYARRIPTGRKDKPGTEVYLSFIDRDFSPSAQTGGTVFAHI
ncbi:MAG: type VI secretion system baseplate subunit TssF, partial [Candidatus Kapabacteria bacterium]|nr:type VI secretion system baseplate subunit TssF [Candidatus Kapabacteria bacterium]